MARSEIDLRGSRPRPRTESCTKTATIGSNQTHFQCRLASRLAPIRALSWWSTMMLGRPIRSSSPSQPGLSSAIRLPSSWYSAEQVGAGHLEARIGEHRPPRPVLALGAVVVLEQRGMGVVIAQEPVGHALVARELRRLVGEPDRLLSPADGSSLAGQRVELAAADPGQHARHRDEGEQAGPEPARAGREDPSSASAPSASDRRAAAHSAKFQAVTAPTTAAN